jgi:hypothetical protein
VALGWAKSTIGLSVGMALLSLVYLASAAVLFLATRLWFARDYYDEHAATR